MGMDLTIGYINKMLLDTIPICRNLLNDGVRCFLFDHHGYLLVHPSFFGEYILFRLISSNKSCFLEKNSNVHVYNIGKDASENQVEDLHLTHVEHLAMSMMLNDETLVKKQHCRQYSDHVIANQSGHGEGHHTYSLSHTSCSRL